VSNILEEAEHQAMLRKLARSSGLIVFAFVVGVVGYKIIGGDKHGFIDAFYMTVITLTTVGYAEAIDLTNSPGGKLFTIALLMFGVGSLVYFFSTLTAFMVEGSLAHMVHRRRMKRMIDKMSGHYIVCGVGGTGECVVRELHETKRPFVAIEFVESRIRLVTEQLGAPFPYVIGDATMDGALLAAGIQHAAGLTTCVSNDKDNFIVTVSARLLNPNLRIISRCSDKRVAKKVAQAGADAVISPDNIGALRMVSELVRPTAVTFLDSMLREKQQNLRFEEHEIEAGGSLDGVSIGELRKRNLRDFLVVAIRKLDDQWVFHPNDEVVLKPDMSLVFIGSPDARLSLVDS